jgi:hypothetical protein
MEGDQLPAPKPSPEPEATPAPAAPKVDKEKVLTFIEDLIDTLTFKRVALIGLLTIIGLILFSLYENRLTIVEKLVQPPIAAEPVVTSWELSEASKTALQNLAKSTNVSFVSVSEVDLKKNRRVVRYYYIDDASVAITPEITSALSLPRAVFDYDAKNTAQMVAILGNEFKCDNYKDTIYFRFAPDLAGKLPTICRLAIPPFVGQFVGFVSVGMSQQLTKQELDTIRLEVSRLAVEIYLNDVTKKPQ